MNWNTEQHTKPIRPAGAPHRGTRGVLVSKTVSSHMVSRRVLKQRPASLDVRSRHSGNGKGRGRLCQCTSLTTAIIRSAILRQA